LEGLEQLQREFGPFRDLLQDRLGRPIEFFAVPNRSSAAEALRAAKVDLVLTGPAEYVLFRQRIGAEPVLALTRPDYFAVFATRGDTGIRNLADLKGRKLALGPVGSTSKHIAPVEMLRRAGLDPREDVQIIHTSIELGWQALLRGDVDAYATTSDKFFALRERAREPQAATLVVLAQGDALPNDVLLARSDLDPVLIRRIRDTIEAEESHFIDRILQGVDNQKYRGMRINVHVRDQDYDPVRAMYAAAGFTDLANPSGESPPP
jgi:phosphonate transport system substrate-binding protein